MLLVGVWEPTDVEGEDPPLVGPVEFTTDGRVLYDAGGEWVPWGTYQVRGGRLEVTVSVGGKDVARGYAIETLTDADLVLAYDGGNQKWTFRRKT